MPVLAIFTSSEITKQMYEALRPEVKWETAHPPGALFHACAFDDKGDFHVADLWESAEAMKEFFSSRLAPALQKLGIPPPVVNVIPVHNVNLYPAALQFLLK